MRVVIDTNVLVSALLKRESTPGRILSAVWAGSLELVLSDPLIAELRSVLAYPKIAKRLPKDLDLALFLDMLPAFTTMVSIAGVEVPVPRDADDAHVLATLVAGQAEWIISGDEDLRVLGAQFPILSPAEFAARFLE